MPASHPHPFRLWIFGFVLAAVALCAPLREAHADGRADPIRAYDEGRYEDVLSALSAGPSTPELAYLKARTLAQLARYGEALRALPTLPASWPERVRTDIARLRLRWAAEAGLCHELEQWAQGERDSEVTRMRARCAFAASDYARAKDLLENARDAEGRAMYVRSLAALGETDKARPPARAFWVEHPAHSEADTLRPIAADAQGKLELTPEEQLSRAQEWIDARKPDAALSELESFDLRKVRDKKQRKLLEARLWHVRGEALFRTRQRYDEAAKAYARAAARGGPSEDYDAFYAIRSESRAGHDRSAIKRYKAFTKRYPKSDLVAEALYLSAWLAGREKLPKARKALADFVTSEIAKKAPGLRADATWDLAWLALEEHNVREARSWLERAASLVTAPMDQARVAYWRGRTELLAHAPDAARTYFRDAIARERLGYYAQLAARRLMALGDTAPPAFEPGSARYSEPTLDIPAEVAFYEGLGLYADAARAASAWIDAQPDRAARVAALLKTGDTAKAHATAEPLLASVLSFQPAPETTWLWRALLPEPYREIVYRHAERHDLDAAELYGHMQVESRYRPWVVSGADALGLLQLLPKTAAQVAESLPAEESVPKDRASLLRPHVNIALGATYLGNLVRYYEGQLPLAIAAYNAGTRRVNEWIKRSGEVELDRWVEQIPVDQTRNYVRRVITAWSRYHALSAPSEPWAIPLPDRLKPRTASH